MAFSGKGMRLTGAGLGLAGEERDVSMLGMLELSGEAGFLLGMAMAEGDAVGFAEWERARGGEGAAGSCAGLSSNGCSKAG